MRSIRRQLTAALLGVIALALLLGGVAIYHMAQEELDELFDYQLRQLALSLRDQAFRQALIVPSEPVDEEFDFVIQVWDPEGIRLYYSHPHQSLPGMAGSGYADINTREGTWRVFATRTRGRVIQVAQPMKVRNDMALEAVSKLLLPLALLLPVLSMLIWIVVSRGLEPLKRLASAVAKRTPTTLDPLPERDVPQEAMSLVRSLNDLLGRLEEAIASQRTFIADAAHELRTPIAALQLQTQLLERAQSEGEKQALLQDLKSGVSRSAHVVQQLLTLARQDPEVASRPCGEVKLGELARSTVVELAVLAEAKGVDLGLAAVDDRAVVQGDPESLRVALGNLLDNALRYTPGNGRVNVSAAVDAEGRPYLEVADSGPGIPRADRPRVFDRFFRGEGIQQPGTGLGLSIVKAIADRHGAAVILDGAEEEGLLVRIVFAPVPHAGA